MTNRIIIEIPEISENSIRYKYTVEGEWQAAFKMDEEYYVKYSCDISGHSGLSSSRVPRKYHMQRGHLRFMTSFLFFFLYFQ